MADSPELINFQLIKPALAQLTDLLTITDTYIDQYYNIFLNPTPIPSLEIKAYGSSGNIETISIPNLAYLRQICLSGSGNPEGVVTAPIGTLYLDTSVIPEVLYVKTGDDTLPITNTEWESVILNTKYTNDITDIYNQINTLQNYIDNEFQLVPNRAFPVYANGETFNVNQSYTLTQSGWLELSNTSNPITITTSEFNGTGEPTIDVTHTVGNYVLMPVLSGLTFIVTTAGTTITLYPLSYQGA